MIEISKGKIYIEGIETTDVTLIGCSMLDYAESAENDKFKVILKEEDVFIEPIITEV